jgi:hypothetical protein
MTGLIELPNNHIHLTYEYRLRPLSQAGDAEH